MNSRSAGSRALDRSPTSDGRAEAQDRQYRFPYHYLPTYDGATFSQTQHWSWGYRYLGRLHVTFELLDAIPFQSLIDIGCGDGRFLSDAHARWPDRMLRGVDCSPVAVAAARRMSPVDVELRDILQTPLERKFDVATLLDVIEHVPPGDVPAFLHAVAGGLREGGSLVLTVPHRNLPLTPKHYQHFDAATLRRLLAADFDDVRCIPFERRSPLLDLLWKLTGGTGRYFLITHPRITTTLFRRYWRRLPARNERECLRLACVARARAGTIDKDAV